MLPVLLGEVLRNGLETALPSGIQVHRGIGRAADTAGFLPGGAGDMPVCAAWTSPRYEQPYLFVRRNIGGCFREKGFGNGRARTAAFVESPQYALLSYR